MKRETFKIIGASILILGIMLSCLYVPLFASLLENELLGTDNVYEAFDAMGLAQPLGVIYEPVVDAIQFILDL